MTSHINETKRKQTKTIKTKLANNKTTSLLQIKWYWKKYEDTEGKQKIYIKIMPKGPKTELKKRKCIVQKLKIDENVSVKQ